MQGELVPMAIPLGAPRQKSGAPPPPLSLPSTPNLPGTSPFASTPLEGHQTPRPQVSVHTEDGSPPKSPSRSQRSEVKDEAIATPRDSPRKLKDQVSLMCPYRFLGICRFCFNFGPNPEINISDLLFVT